MQAVTTQVITQASSRAIAGLAADRTAVGEPKTTLTVRTGQVAVVNASSGTVIGGVASITV